MLLLWNALPPLATPAPKYTALTFWRGYGPNMPIILDYRREFDNRERKRDMLRLLAMLEATE
jgi:peptidoglycan/xylan/chitin deacetylase (PgdA/CDA1 family)